MIDTIIVKFTPLFFSLFFLVGPSVFGAKFKKRLLDSLVEMGVELKYRHAITDRARKLAGVESKCSAAVTLCIGLILNSDTGNKAQAVTLICLIVLLVYMAVSAIMNWDNQKGLLAILIIGYLVLATFCAIPFL